MAKVEIKQVTPPRGIPDSSKLRFVLVSVVSGEHQEKGSSLDDQERDMKKALEILGARFYPEFFFKKQQHRTEGWERLDYQHIKCCIEIGVNGIKANAVMIQRYDRWSRDDVAGQQMRRYMRDNSIEFYILNNRDDLLSPTANLTAGIHGKMSQNYTDQLARNITDGKMKIFKEGKPLSKLPWLWDWYENDKGEIVYFLIENRVKIFRKAISLYQSKKYSSYQAVAIKMKRIGFKWYDRRERKDHKKKGEHKISVLLIQDFVNRKVFHTGIWDDREPFINKFTGESYEGYLELPMEDKGKPISSIETYNRLQAIKKDNSRFNGIKQNDWLLSGIVRCCGEPIVISITTHKGRKYFYYRCKKCNFEVPKTPFEESVVSGHNSTFQDPEEIRKAIQGKPEKKKELEGELIQCKKSIRSIQIELSNIESNFRDKTLHPTLTKKLNEDYTELDEDYQKNKLEIDRLQAELDSLNNLGNINKLYVIVQGFKILGLEGCSFDSKKRFLKSLYPREDKNSYIRVWKEGKTFYWEGKGIISDYAGMFNKVTAKEAEKLRSEVPEKKMLERIIGREPSAEERQVLRKYGLLHKVWWNKKDLELLDSVLENYSVDITRFM